MRNKLKNLFSGKKAPKHETQELEPAFDYAVLTDKGLRRSVNEDSFRIFPKHYLPPFDPLGQLFLVADGMGGLLGGEMASEMACSTIQNIYFSDPSGGSLPDNLRQAYAQANALIYQRACDEDLDHKMGTTCSALVLTNGRAYLAHVGDSRIYLIRRRKIQQMTEDHTEVAELIKNDLISKKDALNHPHRSILSRALGIETEVEVDIQAGFPIESGDRFLLASDGLNKVEPEEIKSILTAQEPSQACRDLVDLVYERGAGDNVTVLVVQIR